MAGALGLLTLGGVAAAPGPGEVGRPHAEVFHTRDHPGAPQNWAIVQDPRGVLYVGNNIGVLEFDGVRWRLIETGNRSTVRALTVGAQGEVYVGGHNEIGYLAADERGRLRFNSLLERLAPEQRQFGSVMGVFETPQGVVFASRSDLLRIDGERVQHWPAQTPFHLPFQVEGQVYLHQPGTGLLRLGLQGPEPMPGGADFADRPVHVLLPLPGGGLLACTRSSACWSIRDEDVAAWPTAVDDRLGPAVLYAGLWLGNGHLALATIRDGVYVLDASGDLVDVLDTRRGLPEPTTLSLLADDQGGLWLGMENGIVRLRYPDPLSFFGENEGLAGTVVSLHRHRGQLYAGTGLGLYRLDTHPGQPTRFAPVPGVEGQIWRLLSWGDRLLVAGASGVLELDDGEVRMLRASRSHSMSLLRSRAEPERLYIGLQDGLASLRHESGQWVDEGTVPGVEGTVRSLAEDADSLWVAPQSAAVLRLGLPPSWLATPASPPAIERFGQANGLPVLTNHFLFDVGGEPRLVSLAGIRRFAPEHGRFELDPRLNRMFSDPDAPGWAYPLFEDGSGRVWIDTEAGRGVLLPLADGDYEWRSDALRPVEWPASAIHVDPDGTSWWGGAEGLVRLGEAVIEVPAYRPTALVRSITSGDGELVFGGAGETLAPDLPHARNALRFEFASPNYGFMQRRQFQTRLEGLDRDWSPWSGETYRDYTNLREGQYRFLVRARDVYGRVGEPAEWRFRMLAPWYRSGWAYLVYGLFLLTAWRFVLRWRTRRLKARNQELKALVDERTAELAGKNIELEHAYHRVTEASLTDPLTGLRNRRFLTECMVADVGPSLREYARWLESARPHPPETADHVFFLVDIDHFKEVNDRFGHAAGDRLLVQFADLLRETFRESDHLVRWGGEEFLAVARFTSREAAAELAERLRACVARKVFDLGQGLSLQRTCSIGFANFPFFRRAPEALDWQRVVDIADHGLYAAKQQGRNAWVGIVAEDALLPDLAAGDAPLDPRRLLEQPGLRWLRSSHPPSAETGVRVLFRPPNA